MNSSDGPEPVSVAGRPLDECLKRGKQIMKTQKLFFTCFFCLLTFTMAAQWEWQNPMPQGNTIDGIHFVDANNGWAVGARTIIHTTDGGFTWELQESGIEPGLQIKDVYFTDLMNGWAVGGGTSFMLRTQDGGNAWAMADNGDSRLPGAFTDICFVDRLTGWAVGWSAVCQDEIMIVHTTDGGETWENQNYDTAFSGYSVCGCFIDQQLGWVAAGGVMIHTSDGGENWVPQNCPSQEYLKDICFIDANHGWAVGENGTVLITSNGGALWGASKDPVLSGLSLYDVSFINTTTGYIGGYNDDDTKNGVLLKTTDGGISWENQLANQQVNSIYCLSYKNDVGGFAAGADGEMFKAVDGGNDWDMISSSVTSCDFMDVFFVDDNTGWAAGGINQEDVITPAIYHTNDAGTTWNEQQVPLSGNNYILKLFFTNTQCGWAMARDHDFGGGMQLICTIDGGEIWELQSTEEIGGDLFFINSLVGWRVGSNGAIQKTEDGGWTWSDQVSGTDRNLTTVTFIDNETGWCAGDSIIIHTTDAGESWIEQSSGIFPWRDIYFNDQQNGWVVGYSSIGPGPYSSGKIMQTNDGGNTWEEIEGLNFPGISIVYFSDLQNGWILCPPAGVYNSQIKKTDDGGATWDKQFITARVDGLCFTDANNAWAVGFNGTILHTTNGGAIGIENNKIKFSKFKMQAYPNPFTTSATIHFTLPNASHTSLSVYDITGKHLETILSKNLPKGDHQINWNARFSRRADGLNEGIYFIRLETEKATQVQKVIILK